MKTMMTIAILLTASPVLAQGYVAAEAAIQLAEQTAEESYWYRFEVDMAVEELDDDIVRALSWYNDIHKPAAGPSVAIEMALAAAVDELHKMWNPDNTPYNGMQWDYLAGLSDQVAGEAHLHDEDPQLGAYAALGAQDYPTAILASLAASDDFVRAQGHFLTDCDVHLEQASTHLDFAWGQMTP